MARTGLIFTRSQEGTQPGRLTQPGQTEQGIPHHVPSRWVLAGGTWAAGSQSRLGSTRQRVVRVPLCIPLFVLCILPIGIVVVTVPFVCCSVRTALIPTYAFLPFSFYSPPRPSGDRGGRAAAWPYSCQPQPNYNKNADNEITFQKQMCKGQMRKKIQTANWKKDDIDMWKTDSTICEIVK